MYIRFKYFLKSFYLLIIIVIKVVVGASRSARHIDGVNSTDGIWDGLFTGSRGQTDRGKKGGGECDKEGVLGGREHSVASLAAGGPVQCRAAVLRAGCCDTYLHCTLLLSSAGTTTDQNGRSALSYFLYDPCYVALVLCEG